MTDDAHDLKISRLIRAPRGAVWKAWTVPEHLEKWFCPKPWRAEVRAMDLRPGGAFDVEMFGPNGETHSEPGCFLEIVPESRLVFTSSLKRGWRPSAPFLAMTAIVELADAEGGTAYTARALHQNAEDMKRHEEMGFHDGWNTAATQMEEIARTLA